MYRRYFFKIVDESMQPHNMIIGSRVFDVGYVYNAFKGMSFFFQRLITDNKSKHFESYYAQNSSAAIYYNNLLVYFEDME